MRPIEQGGLESTDDGVECQEGRVLRLAIPLLMECRVKLQSAQSSLGSMARLLNVVCSLLMFLLDVYSFKYE
jgi:hypothetical protein